MVAYWPPAPLMSFPAHRRLPLFLFLLLTAAGCSSVAYDSTYDPEVDFAALQTFDWWTINEMSPNAISEAGIRQLVAAQLEAKGLRQSSEQPDLLVAVYRTVEGTMNSPRSGYEWRNGKVRRYTMQSGSMVVDLILADGRKIAWSGSAAGAFNADMTPAERQEMLAPMIERMFADYPPRR